MPLFQLDGYAAGFVDDTHLLAEKFSLNGITTVYEALGAATRLACTGPNEQRGVAGDAHRGRQGRRRP